MFYLYSHREILHSLLYSRMIIMKVHFLPYTLIVPSFFSLKYKKFYTIPRKLHSSLLWYTVLRGTEIIFLAPSVTKFSIVCQYFFLANTLFKYAPLFLKDKFSLIPCRSFQQHTAHWSSSLYIYVVWLLLSNVLLLTHGE